LLAKIPSNILAKVIMLSQKKLEAHNNEGGNTTFEDQLKIFDDGLGIVEQLTL
jgi:hypothetical protein